MCVCGGGWGGGARSSPIDAWELATPSPSHLAAAADVLALLGMRHLQHVIMGASQPRMLRRRSPELGFSKLHALLRRRGINLTSNDSKYPLQTLNAFDVVPQAPPGVAVHPL